VHRIRKWPSKKYNHRFSKHDCLILQALGVQVTFSKSMKRKKSYLDIWIFRLQLPLLIIGINCEIFGQQFSIRKEEKESKRNFMNLL